LGLKVKGLGVRFMDFWFRVHGLEFMVRVRVQGFRAPNLGFRV
jgi:hypothetical protein